MRSIGFSLLLNSIRKKLKNQKIYLEYINTNQHKNIQTHSEKINLH